MTASRVAVAQSHFSDCRARVPDFVRVTYTGYGAVMLNKRAFGRDLLIAPFNFLMGIPNFVIRMVAVVLRVLKFRTASARLGRCHLGAQTDVQRALLVQLETSLLQEQKLCAALSAETDGMGSISFQKSVRTYVQTRLVAADLTTGTLAAVVGLLMLGAFTPGSVSAGAELARFLALENAVDSFFLGESIGRWYYSVVPPEPSKLLFFITFSSVMVVTALVSAFAGFIHDPLQAMLGIHERRLLSLINSLEGQTLEQLADDYQPNDVYVGRLYDLIDWVKALWAMF